MVQNIEAMQRRTIRALQLKLFIILLEIAKAMLDLQNVKSKIHLKLGETVWMETKHQGQARLLGNKWQVLVLESLKQKIKET